MDSHAAMRMCLEEMDVSGVRSLWHIIAPDAPQPQSDFEAIITIHMARTCAIWMTQRQRYYSHRWLLDHGYSSQLPDREKPAAERMYPQVSSGVGISLSTSSPILEPAIPIIRGAMEYAVLEAYADGRRDDIPHIKKRMAEARTTTMHRLFGK